MNNTLIQTYTIDSYSTDFEKKYDLCSLLRHYQNAVFLHADELGVDGTTIWNKFKAIWIITRMRVDLGEMPKWRDVIEVETYPLTPGIVRMEREGVIKKDGKAFANISSEWVVLDQASGRPKRPSDIDYPDVTHREGRVAGEYSNLAFAFDESDYVYSYTARVSDIDMNRHFNNIAYARLAVDAFSAEELENKKLKSFEIAFKAQSFEGETLRIYRKNIGDRKYAVSAFKENGTAVFETTFQF